VALSGVLALAGLVPSVLAGPSTTPRAQDPSAAEAGAVHGRLVTCAGSLPGARVSIEGGPSAVVSGPTGLFVLSPVPAGTRSVTIEVPGQPRTTVGLVQVVEGQVTELGDVLVGDFTTNAEHCGACGARCPTGASCVYGACLCPEGLVRCVDACVALDTLQDCRACGNICQAGPNMTPRCEVHDCVFLCAEGTADCDSRRTTGCETLIDFDPANCGACGVVCGPGQECIDGTCRRRAR
jgi:hypothetical protein